MRRPSTSPPRGVARVGCSGWQYREWRGPVYPHDLPATLWFASYASRFDTVELNSTFYRLPTERAVRNWAAQAPEGFVYSVKVGQFGSHRKKLRNPEQWLANHLDRAALLGPALGPQLVQLPPRWRRDVARLDDFLAAVDDLAPPSMRWAVELRDPSWVHDDVFATLAAHGAALCVHDLLDAHPFELTTSWTYLRFHGPHATARPYAGRYPRARLASTAERLRDLLARGVDTYAYFNNDIGAAAVHDAAALRAQLASTGSASGAAAAST